MLSVESILPELKKAGVEVFGICCDNVDSLHVWSSSLGTIAYPILADFWPHGKVCSEYGVLNKWGVPDRVLVLLDKDGKVVYLDNNHVNEIPPNAPLLEVCNTLGV